eukprot:IDg17405t1
MDVSALLSCDARLPGPDTAERSLSLFLLRHLRCRDCIAVMVASAELDPARRQNSLLSTGALACSGKSQGLLVALRCSNRPILVFLLRASRAFATAYATSNTVTFIFIEQSPAFRPNRPVYACTPNQLSQSAPSQYSQTLSLLTPLYNTPLLLHS